MNKTYALSDLHGMYSLWEQISNYLDDTDTVIFLGDAIDRGTENLRTVFSLLSDKRVKYLKGNHEELLVNALTRMGDREVLDMNDIDVQMWVSNGGNHTMNEIIGCQLSNHDIRYLVNKLKKLPYDYTYKNSNGKDVYLCHAGVTYGVTTVNVRGVKYPKKQDDLIWDRGHFCEKWLPQFDNIYCIHGHTPVEGIVYDLKIWLKRCGGDQEEFTRLQEASNHPSAILSYCDGHKICIDTGAFYTKTAALLDLDTFEPIYFKEKENKNESTK